MADDDELDDIDEGGDDFDDEEGGGSKKKGPGKKLILIIVGVLLLVVAGASAAYFTGLLEGLVGGGDEVVEATEGEEAPADQVHGGGEVIFLELPELLVNLNTQKRKQSFLKIRVSLELSDEADKPKVEGVMPRIIDNFQVYLRELRLEDLQGSAGMYRLREELLTRVNAAVAPAHVNDVLFKEMLVQ